MHALRNRLRRLVASFAGRRVLALGDMVADEYILGRPVRLSREAPLPVLEWVDRYIVPGGAANVARNVGSLGASVAVAGVIGRDEPGQALRQRLEAAGIDTAGIIEEEGRPTSSKTRIIGGSPQVVSQQLARIDRVVRTALLAQTQARLLDYLQSALPRFDAMILSDYENGVIGADVIGVALPLARQHGLTIVVDAHGGFERFAGITVATPNQDEAALAVGRELHTDDEVRQAGHDLLRLMDARGVLITRGGEGMTVVEADGPCHHLPATSPSEVRDVTGAGDTVAAAATLALATGASLLEAAHLGNLAAGLVIRRLGTATVACAEVLTAIEASNC
ncbi:MAG TPA: PfkB family carbohydrate kinase [Chloroflexota bacterium]|nr:PfkB family carbohydrate kinase [Chloroflexota bacterium]